MPITPSHPSIFPDEFSRDERAIAALPTSITAFVGRAARGPVDEPVRLASFADFARSFGGLETDAPLGRALQEFFESGGREAIAVRVAKHAKAARLEHGAVRLSAASDGGWGNQLRIRIRRGLDSAFHLQIRDGVTGRIETHPSLTFRDSPRRIDRVVNAHSQLVRWTAASPRADAPILEHAPQRATGKTPWSDDAASTKVERAARGSCGCELTASDFIGSAKHANQQGLYALERVDLFNLLVIPPYRDGRDVDVALWKSAAGYCERRRALLLVDPRRGCASPEDARRLLETLGLRAPHAAILLARPPHAGSEQLSSGAAAGMFARTDAQRGVWRAPAGLGATLNGVRRSGSDSLADDSACVAARRMALFLERSLQLGLRWAESERNDESLWARIRASAGDFMHGFFRLGAFPGRTPRDAYFVRCDEETTSQRDIERGIVNVVVGFAPLRPAEFVTIALQQMTKLPS